MQKKRFFIIGVLTILIVAIAIIGYAASLNNYAIDIVDDGSTHLANDEQSIMTKKIIQDNLTDFVYEVKVTNTLAKTNSKEVAILIDNSNSMQINDEFSLVTIKERAEELVNGLFSQVNGVRVSLSNNTGVNANLTTSSYDIARQLNSIEYNSATMLDEGIAIAKNTLTQTEGIKYLIIFTDATDKANQIQEIREDRINVVWVTTDMTRTSLGTPEQPLQGEICYVSDENFSFDFIYNKLNSAISNVVVSDTFSDEVNSYFDFEIVQKSDTQEVEKIATGYNWKIGRINAGESTTLQFRLKLKENANVDSGKVYRELQTSKKTKVIYGETENNKSYETELSPTFVICDKYSITLRAVSAENRGLVVDGIKFKVVGTDEEGKEIYNQTLTTDGYGQVYIENLKTLGKIKFFITPDVDGKIGYAPTSSTEINAVNDALGRGLSLETDNLYNEISNNKRSMLVEIPIEVQHFAIEILLRDLEHSDIVLGETDFRLIQPKLNNKYEMDVLYGTTDETGRLVLNPAVMTKDGVYDYILSQMTEQADYEPMGNVTLRVTFENGSVKKIEKKYNDNVTAELAGQEYIKLYVGNKAKIEETFNFELILAEKESPSIGIAGAKYTISVTRDNGSTSTYSGQTTDKEGKINLVVPGNGYVQIKITEELPKAGYVEDKEPKEVIVYRRDKRVQYVAKTTPSDLETQINGDTDKLTVKLYSESKSNQNVIQLQLADLVENDIFIPGVSFNLVGPLTGENYSGTTDENGIITFIVYSQEQGSYPYQLICDNSTIPYGYSPIEDTLDISIRYDVNGIIEDASAGIEEKNIAECYKKDIVDEENQKTYNTAYVLAGLEVNEAEANYFKIHLTDYATQEVIDNAAYDINITSGEVNRVIKGRKTDAEGNIKTRIMGSIDDATITIVQTKAKKAYSIDETEQVIQLRKVNGRYAIVSQEPYDYQDGKNGAQAVGNDIVYYHTNERKTGDDVLLNLYVNKMDEQGNLLGNVALRISSDTLIAPDGSLLDTIMLTDQYGYIELEGIRVPDMPIPGEKEYFLYLIEVDNEEDKNEKKNTEVKVKLTFRYNENKEIVELTNAEPTWGNRLIKDKTFNGYETEKAYESNLFFDIYGNYGDVGNFSMDFTKKNIDDQLLSGAKYDILVMRPDGSTLSQKGIEIKDIVEIPGIFVTKETKIEITEVEAPIGYDVNPTTEVFEITNIDSDTGEITVEKTSGSDKAKITSVQLVPMEDGTLKTCVGIDFIDTELSTFKFGIKTIDSTTQAGVAGYCFNIRNSRGAISNTGTTSATGDTNTLIGAPLPEGTITYTIKGIQTPTYYKALRTPINVIIAFDPDGKVDVMRTMGIQTDANYGITWSISGANVIDGNDFDMTIIIDPQEPLTVKVQTIDKITNKVIQNPEYQIQPSINLNAIGTDEIKVGYVAPNSLQTYRLNQRTEISEYNDLKQQSFSISYDENGDIQGISSVSSEIEVEKTQNSKEISIKVYREPKVPFVIENVSFFRNEPLQGAKYKISSQEGDIEITTDLQGMGTKQLGHLGTSTTVRYTVEQTATLVGYAKIDNFQIDVTYNENKEIINAVIVGEENRWIEISHIQPSSESDYGYNGNDKGIVKIKVKSYPELIINIQNVDRLDNSITLSGTEYEVVSTIPTQATGTTIDNGIWQAHLGKTLINNTVSYTITEKRPAALYQTLEDSIEVEVSYDENGYVGAVRLVSGEEYASASKLEQVVEPEDNFKFNVQIRNNKKTKFNITLTHNEIESIVLTNARFKATARLGEEVLSTDEIATDQFGKGMLSLDKALANRTIEYTIQQTKKNAGYEFPSEDIKIEVTYDSDGRIIADSCRITSGTEYVQITRIDPDNFDIDLKIVNRETKEFGVSILTTDKYDTSIGIPGVKYDTYLTTGQYQRDPNYTGEATTNEIGEAYVQFGKYNAEHGSTRTLILDESNLPDEFRTIAGRLVVNIEFDANGVITNTTVAGGYNSYIGWCADGRFIEVSHTNYTVIVHILHFPWIDVSLSVEDMYTGEKLEGNYTISSTEGPGSYEYAIDTGWIRKKIEAVKNDVLEKEAREITVQDLYNYFYVDNSITRVTFRNIDEYGEILYVQVGEGSTADVYYIAGDLNILEAKRRVYTGGLTGRIGVDYIGYGLPPIFETNYTTSATEEYVTQHVLPAEQSSTRKIFIYEINEPNEPRQYQKYRPYYLTWHYNRILAEVTLYYNGKGRIERVSVTDYRSNNNIQDGYVDAQIIDGTDVKITVKYAPITTIESTSLDAVTKEELGNIRISPYQNTGYNTRSSYEYRTIGYYTTDSQGVAKYQYWSANIAGDQNRYFIDSDFVGSEYNGYFNPGRIKLDVAYDERGRVSAVNVLSTDEFGNPNAEVVGWDENNIIKINILYQRKFNLKINKVDMYDDTSELTAGFTLASEATTEVISGQTTTVGRIIPGTTAKFTVSETSVPGNYVPITNFDFYVYFNNDGTVGRAWSDSEYFEFVKAADAQPGKNGINITDLEITIKNKPRFTVKLGLSDEFYPDLKLANATFEMTNNKGDIAIGNPKTDGNGYLNTYIGPAYPNETVLYTIRQTNIMNGYYENTQEIVVEVTFKEDGRIKNYHLVSGDQIVTLDENAYQNQRYIQLGVTNKPKDIKFAIYKYDSIQNQPMTGIKFNIKAEEVGKVPVNKQVTTNENGNVVDVIDQFISSNNGRVVTYTISEIQVPDSYRKIEDVVLQIRYNEDGSIASRIVQSNPSGVDIKVAVGKNILRSDSQPVHVTLAIPNDNAYDLIIKNEDSNFAGLGIEGSTFDVTVNGEVVQANETNTNGITRINKLTQSGEITIRVAQNKVGPGYRDNTNNDTTIVLQKGTQVYSLELDSNSNPTYATVEVDEEHGTVTVTFKNETKSELEVVKDDINTGVVLPGTRFEITAQEKDNYGNNIGTATVITQTDVNDVTDEEGKLHFDLGVTPQSKIIAYTFKELEVSNPEKYDLISDIELLVEYDMYGKIKSMEKDSFRLLATTDPQNPNKIVAIISNGIPGVDGSGDGSGSEGDNNPMPYYNLKIVSEDAQTKLRINESEFDIEVNTESGAQEKLVEGQQTGDVTRAGYVVDKGMLVVEELREQGNITVQINQTKAAEGYIFGKQQTSGTVKYNASYTPGATVKDSELNLQLIDDGGFEVIVDNTNRELIIKVKNESEVVLNINKQVKTEIQNDDGSITQEYIPLQGIKFEVTAKIQTATNEEETDLFVTSKMTDEEGNTKVSLGNPYPGKNVLYTIHEIENENYKDLGDIVLLIQYNTRGLIKYFEILSNQDQAEGSEEMLGTRKADITIYNEEADFADRYSYNVILEKHHIDDPTYSDLIPGASFEITVEEEYGEEAVTWRSTTNEEGIIISQDFNGYGRIKITLVELTAPDGYKLDETERVLQIYRNKKTGIFNEEDSNVGFSVSDDNREVIVKPVDEPADNTYSIILNKVDEKTNSLIIDNTARFEIDRIQRKEVPVENDEAQEQPSEETEIVEIRERIEATRTDRKGKIILANFPTPEEEGTYTYVFKEVEAPKGYKLPEQEFLLEVTFAKNEKNNMIITSAVSKSEGLDILVQKNQTLSIVIKNKKDSGSQEGMFGIDITKIDKETQEAITNDTTVFKLTYPDGTYSYFETDENGQYSINDLTIPAQEGTTTYILNEVKAPEGYLLERNDIKISIVTKINDLGKMYVESVNVNGKNAIDTDNGQFIDNKVNLQITNEKGEIQPGQTNTKTYDLVINKLDKHTQQILPNVDFRVSLVNGENVKASTNIEGKLIIENVYMPIQPGEYDIVIEELTTPKGYKEDTEFKILKATFEGYGEEMIITKLELDPQNNKNIELVAEKCTNTHIEANIYNESNDDLYVKSKKHEDGRYIYDFYYDGVNLTHYKIDVAFIDNIEPGSIAKFLQNIDTNATKLELFDATGKQITTGRIRTGLKLVATKGELQKEFMIVVPADTDQNGRIDQNDYEKISTVIAPDVTRRKKTEINLVDSLIRRAADVAVRIGRVDQNDYEQVVNKAANK